MDSIAVRLRFLNYSRLPGLILPLHLCEKLQLQSRQRIRLSLGKREVTATVLTDERRPDSKIVKMTTELKYQLGVPHGGPIHLKREGEVIRIGPSIGIVTTGVRDDDDRPIGARSSFFRKLLSTQKGKGIFYFIFSPADVDWEHNLVDAWFLRPAKKGGLVWRRYKTPLPDVVYDRIPSRTAERRSDVQRFKLRLAELNNLPMFNRGFFDKWGVHKLLYPNPSVNEHIPETHPTATLATIRTMLQKHKMIYLKPKHGSLGYGIIKVVHNRGKGYEVSYHSGRGNVKRRFQSVRDLYRHVFRTRRMNSYLVQQGIKLSTYRGRPFDFRVHLHKNQQNEWVVSCMAAKVAGQGSVTTHVRTGGTVIPGQELLSDLFGRYHSLVEERIRRAAIRIAAAIEEAADVHLGELGLDMGIDLHGHVWMFEANSKPGRSIFKHARLKEEDLMSCSLIVDYGRYLANF